MHLRFFFVVMCANFINPAFSLFFEFYFKQLTGMSFVCLLMSPSDNNRIARSRISLPIRKVGYFAQKKRKL